MEIDFSESSFHKIVDCVSDAHILYHYTSIEAFFGGIIVKQPEKNKEICLWASNCQYMNDPEELNTGIQFANEIFDISTEILEQQIVPYNQLKNNLYITSFSTALDSLPMWAMYGKNGNGIALGLEKSIIENTTPILYKCIYATEPNKTHLKSEVSKVLFDNLSVSNTDNQLNEDNKLAVKFLSDIVSTFALYVIFCFISKDPSYIYEHEVRSVILSTGTAKYRIKNNLIIPYIEQYFPKSALKEIWIGPTNDMDRATQSLRVYLDHMGFNNVEIKQSKVPYRE